jgi:hypothetical protein
VAERDAVLLDWGGVMTGDLFGSFAAYCENAGLEPGALADLFRHDREARTLLIDFECGRMEEGAFEERLAGALGLSSHNGLVEGLMAGVTADEHDAATRAGPYGLLNAVLDELVDVGALSSERRQGADVACWAAVHGYAELHVHGPLRDVPAMFRDQVLESVLDVVHRGLLG